MAVYRVTSPDGQRYKVNGPEGASQAEVIAVVQREIAREANKPDTEPDYDESAFDKIFEVIQ